jgi:two-component system, OmpR family, sensor histidine kinase TctE
MTLPGVRPTLRRQLLEWLLWPLVLVMAASSVAAYYVAVRFATIAYDRTLFDTTLDISGQIKVMDGDLHVDLPRAAAMMIESDEYDRVYYMVSGPSGRFIVGHRGLPAPPGGATLGKPIYYDGEYLGAPVRVAALYIALEGLPERGNILVQMAETLNKRHILANEILFAMLIPEALLIMLVWVVVWNGVARGLRPLDALGREIAQRSHRDLSPLPETNVPAELQSLTGAMNGLFARLGVALSAQRRFVADAAHQLRTPLAGIRTQAELALRQGDLADVRHTLTQLNAASGRTTRLVNQLLSLARAEPGAEHAQAIEKIDLRALARTTTMEWVPQAIEHHIDLGFEGDEPVWIEGDPLLLKEMLSNLLDNALRYTPAGGQVTVRTALSNKRPELTVDDNGPGIPPEEREQVFERFYRVLGSGAEGCGLGLAIVREIAEGHGARVALGTGSGGNGTSVRVTFSAV